MLRTSLLLVGLVASSATAGAQQALTNRVHTVAAPTRDAGIYHVATNTWTRKAAQAEIGADIIYNNTWPFSPSLVLFGPLSGDHFIDEGRIPSPSSPTTLYSRPGCAASYTIDGAQFGYCTDQQNGGSFTLHFYETYTACAPAPGVPTGTITIAGPGSLGGIQCWLVTVDLDPASGFVMQADGNGSFNTISADRFGWEMSSVLAPALATLTGPIIAGDPNSALQYDGTRWDSPINYAEDGTGMSSYDGFRVEGGPTTPGCYFGGSPFRSFHLELYADACSAPPTGVGFCDGVTGLACPCANGGIVGNGCANSLHVSGSNLTATGVPSLSADTVSLNSTLTPNASVLFFQGTNQNGIPAGSGTLLGDGKRCAGGTVIRLGTKTAVLGASSYPVGADSSVSVQGAVTMPGSRTYQAWYRNAAAFCTAATFNLSNGYEISWGV